MYLDNYFSTQFVEQLENYIRTDLMKLLRSCASDAGFCDDNRLRMYILPGEEAHWRDSLVFAKVSGGFIPWGSENYEKMFFKTYWSLYKGKGFGVFDPPIINVFYCKNRGIIGLGLVVAIMIDGLNPFWASEKSPRDTPRKYMFRWFTKIIWLHQTVLANIEDPSKWSGVKAPDSIKNQGFLQGYIRSLDGKPEFKQLKHEVLKALINDVERDLDTVLKVFKERKEGQAKPVPVYPYPSEKCVLNVSSDDLRRIKEEVLKEFVIDPELLDFLLSILVYGCKNVLMIGRPGTGKTSIARFIAEKLKFKPVIVTANAHWSRVDVIGGPMFIANMVTWRPGILMQALAEHLKVKGDGWRGVWLIIDEINRADVDKAFGEFFTIFSGPEPSEWIIPESIIREWEKYASQSGEKDPYYEDLNTIVKALPKTDRGYMIPPDFRVIGTMNYVDVSNLFTIGEAFTRRFVRIVIDYPQSEKDLEVYVDKELEVLVNKIRRSKEFDEEALKILDSVRDTIKKAVIELRKIDRLAFGTAHLLNALHTFLAEVKLKHVTGASIESIKNDSKKILKHAIESALSITPLWDEDLRNKIENKLKGALGPS
jgi:MoxR-like ATPase